MKTFIGIDPGGSSGAIAWIKVNDSDNIDSYRHLEFSKNTLREWSATLNVLGLDDYVWAVCESVHSMPGQGVSSSFKFGINRGHIEMGLVSAGISHEFVTPQKWMMMKWSM